jgi:PilZ domain
MTASNLAILKAPSTKPAELPSAASGPTLCCKPLLRAELPRRFIRVPTYAVGVHPEHREYPRATLNLPLQLSSVAGVPETFPITLVTRDISSTGVYFLCPRELPANAAIELQIVLVSRPMGQGNVVMVSLARVRRVQPAATPGWFGIAASFDDVQFDRDDCVPSRFHGV